MTVPTNDESRELVLARIHAALAGDTHLVSQPRGVTTPGVRLVSSDDREARVALFAERVEEYRAAVHLATSATVTDVITAAIARRGAASIVIPADLPVTWRPSVGTCVVDEALSHAALDAMDGVITGCALAIAQTGTIVLDASAAQGRRVISLLPDFHLCVLRASQIHGIVPEAIAALEGEARHRRPLTFISGPSATSDIELHRVEGVHGPRTLVVVVITDA